MNDRYSRVFTLPENLYTPGSPLVIAAGTLLRDNRDGKVLAQLKFRNIGAKRITAVRIRIKPYDSFARPLGASIDSQYLDLCAERDRFFAQKTPVILPDNTTRSYTVSVTEVAFEDMTLWQSSPDTVWESLPEQKSQYDELDDPDLCDQYAIDYGGDLVPMDYADLWFCTCGAINRKGEKHCHVCDCRHSALKNIDMDELEEHKEQRLAEEHREDALWEKAKTIAIIVVACVLVFVFLCLIGKGISRHRKYNEAKILMSAGNYEEAAAAFEDINGYKDSESMVLLCRYDEAAALMNEGQYNEAVSLFQTLGDYADSADKAEACELEIWNEENAPIRKLVQYVQEHADESYLGVDVYELTFEEDGVTGKIEAADDSVVCIVSCSTEDKDTDAEAEYTTTLKLTYGEDRAAFTQENTMEMDGAEIGTTASGTLDPAQYEYGADLVFTDISEVDGSAKSSVSDRFSDITALGLDTALNGLDEVLQKLGLSIEDLGFTSYDLRECTDDYSDFDIETE